MGWTAPFVVFRHKGNGSFEEVFCTSDFKKAKYWLTYIAETGDCLCRTPAHPNFSGLKPCPEYFSHKEQPGSVSSDGALFCSSVLKGAEPEFPAEQSIVDPE